MYRFSSKPSQVKIDVTKMISRPYLDKGGPVKVLRLHGGDCLADQRCLSCSSEPVQDKDLSERILVQILFKFLVPVSPPVFSHRLYKPLQGIPDADRCPEFMDCLWRFSCGRPLREQRFCRFQLLLQFPALVNQALQLFRVVRSSRYLLFSSRSLSIDDIASLFR